MIVSDGHKERETQIHDPRNDEESFENYINSGGELSFITS